MAYHVHSMIVSKSKSPMNSVFFGVVGVLGVGEGIHLNQLGKSGAGYKLSRLPYATCNEMSL